MLANILLLIKIHVVLVLQEHFKSFQGQWIIKSRDLFHSVCKCQKLQGWDHNHCRDGKISGKAERWKPSKIKELEKGNRKVKRLAASFTQWLLGMHPRVDTRNVGNSGESPHHCT